MTSTAILKALTIFAHAVVLTLLLGDWLAGQWPGQPPRQVEAQQVTLLL